LLYINIPVLNTRPANQMAAGEIVSVIGSVSTQHFSPKIHESDKHCLHPIERPIADLVKPAIRRISYQNQILLFLTCTLISFLFCASIVFFKGFHLIVRPLSAAVRQISTCSIYKILDDAGNRNFACGDRVAVKKPEEVITSGFAVWLFLLFVFLFILFFVLVFVFCFFFLFFGFFRVGYRRFVRGFFFTLFGCVRPGLFG